MSKTLKNVSSSKALELSKMYPFILDLFMDEPVDIYSKIFISAFNKWPNENDFSSKILESSNLSNFYKRHRTFNHYLVNKFDCYTIRFKGQKKETINFKKFLSKEKAQEYLEPSPYNISSNSYFNLLMPECEVIYFENFDFSNVLYYRDENKISDIITSCNLHELYILK
jgi:hypothetical protein